MMKSLIIRKRFILTKNCLTEVAVLPPFESRRSEGGRIATFLNGKESITL
jgi:hypothetical protein